jgi:proton glutamate symport protein
MMSRSPLALHWKIVIGLVLGIVTGLALNAAHDPIRSVLDAGGPVAWAFRFVADLTGFIGDVFIRALRFVAVPIVLFSLIAGAAGMGDIRRMGRVGGRALVIYLGTTAVAVAVGLLLANLVKPGSYISEAARDRLAAGHQADVTAQLSRTGEVPGLWRQLLDLIPANPFAALAGGVMLQVIVFALAIGLGLTLIDRDKARPVIALFETLTDVIVRLVHIIMRMAPYAVFALIVPVVTKLGVEVLTSLAVYAATVIGGLLLLLLVEYPLLLRVFAGVGFARFFRAMAPAQLLAFSSSSSSATLPVTMECARDRLGASEEVTSFVCPLGATINMDGTALYQAVATVFITELYQHVELTIGQQVTVMLTAVLASIGTPGIPGAGVLMLIIVLESVGIPPASIAGGIAVIMGVDRLLDMCRTVVNVSGDGMTAAIVARGEGTLLHEAEVAQRPAR